MIKVLQLNNLISVGLILLKIFKVNDDEVSYSIPFKSEHSQVVNSSLDIEYMIDILKISGSFVELIQQNKSEANEWMLLDQNSLDKNIKYDQLVLMIENCFQKLSNTLDMLLSAQNALAGILRI